MEKFLNILQSGGPMMVPLGLLALIGLTLFLERLFFLHKGQIRAMEFVSGIKEALKKRRLLEALTLCDETPGPVPRIVKAALVNSERSFDTMRQSVLAQADAEVPLLERRIAGVRLVAKIAPYLGFMGTLLALLNIFFAMSKSGSYASASAFSADVYNALISTVAGFAVYIVAVLCHSMLFSRMKAIIYDIQWSANSILKFISDGMPENEDMLEGNGAKSEK